MANAALSGGWTGLGSTIAGGNSLDADLSYAQGESLGARTQDALAQARARIDENNAKENLDASLAGAVPDPKTRAGIVAFVQANRNPNELFDAQKTNQEVQGRTAMMDPNTSDAQTARTAFALGQPAQIIHPIGEFQSTNALHPDLGVQATDLGTQLAGAKLAQQSAQTAAERSTAAKNTDEIANPQKYRVGLPPPVAPGSDGSGPIANETIAQLVASGDMPMPTPGRALNMMGGEDFVKRVNYLAGQKGKAPADPNAAPPMTAPPPTGAAPAAPGVVPDGTTPAAAAAPAPFQSNFHGQNYSARGAALKDEQIGQTGKQTDAINRTASHLDVMDDLSQKLGNSNFVASNQFKNWFQQQTGQPMPGNTALAAHILGTEIVKSMTVQGAGTGEERGALASAFTNAQSPAEFKGAIDTASALLRGQAQAFETKENANGVPGYMANRLSPNTRKRLGVGEFAPGGAGQTATPTAAPGGMATVKSDADYEALPSGTKFTGPDGVARVKP